MQLDTKAKKSCGFEAFWVVPIPSVLFPHGRQQQITAKAGTCFIASVEKASPIVSRMVAQHRRRQ